MVSELQWTNRSDNDDEDEVGADVSHPGRWMKGGHIAPEVGVSRAIRSHITSALSGENSGKMPVDNHSESESVPVTASRRIRFSSREKWAV